jgi:hypothetical protein
VAAAAHQCQEDDVIHLSTTLWAKFCPVHQTKWKLERSSFFSFNWIGTQLLLLNVSFLYLALVTEAEASVSLPPNAKPTKQMDDGPASYLSVLHIT